MLELRVWFNDDQEGDFEHLSEIGAGIARKWPKVNYSVEEVEDDPGPATQHGRTYGDLYS